MSRWHHPAVGLCIITLPWLMLIGCMEKNARPPTPINPPGLAGAVQASLNTRDAAIKALALKLAASTDPEPEQTNQWNEGYNKIVTEAANSIQSTIKSSGLPLKERWKELAKAYGR